MNHSIIVLAALCFSFINFIIGSPVESNQGSKIVGGHEAEPHSHPYQISLQKKILWMHSHTCGGSIINENWILTAAHCVGESLLSWFIPLDVFAGIHSLKGKEDSTQIIRVVEKVVHPDYKGGVAPNDIALLRLQRPLRFSSKIRPITLPEPDSTPEGESTLSGWGLRKSGRGEKVPEFLQEIDLPVLTFKECNDSIEAFRESEEDENPLDERSNVCTGPLTGGKSACNGDSGGPLVQKMGNDTVQIGVVSWGMNPCGTKGAPSVYTKVSSFIDFIKERLDYDDY